MKFRVDYELPLEGLRERDPKRLCDEATVKIAAIDGVASCSGAVGRNAIEGTVHIDAPDPLAARSRVRSGLNNVSSAEGLSGHRWSLAVNPLDSEEPR